MMNEDNEMTCSGCYTIPDDYDPIPSVINVTYSLKLEVPSGADVLSAVYSYCNTNNINVVLKHSETTGMFLWKKTRYYLEVTGERSSVQSLSEYLKECLQLLNKN